MSSFAIRAGYNVSIPDIFVVRSVLRREYLSEGYLSSLYGWIVPGRKGVIPDIRKASPWGRYPGINMFIRKRTPEVYKSMVLVK